MQDISGALKCNNKCALERVTKGLRPTSGNQRSPSHCHPERAFCAKDLCNPAGSASQVVGEIPLRSKPPSGSPTISQGTLRLRTQRKIPIGFTVTFGLLVDTYYDSIIPRPK